MEDAKADENEKKKKLSLTRIVSARRQETRPAVLQITRPL